MNPYGSDGGRGGGLRKRETNVEFGRALMLQLLTQVIAFLGHGAGGAYFLPMKIQSSRIIELRSPVQAP